MLGELLFHGTTIPGKVCCDRAALAALLIELTRKLGDLRSLLPLHDLASLGPLGAGPRLEESAVDIFCRLVDLYGHGLVLREQFVALTGDVAQTAEQFFEFFALHADDCLGTIV